jgi:hypothetical protein
MLSMTELASDLIRTKELGARATGAIALAVAMDTRLSDNPAETMRARGFARFLTKGAVDPIATTDSHVGQTFAAAFLAHVDLTTLSGRLDGAVRLPLNATARLQVGTITASETAEGAQKLVGTIGFDISGPPTKVSAQIIVTAETLHALDQATQNGLRDLLASACAAATDAALVSALTAGTPVGSPVTVATLFAAISTVRPYLIVDVGTLLGLPTGTLADLAAAGIRVLTSPAANGALIAVDAAGVLLSDDEAEIATAKHAAMFLDSGGSPPSTTLVSLWQKNLSALRCERFARSSVRSGAVAFGAP